MQRNPLEIQYKKIPPEPLFIFRRTTPRDKLFLPELAKNRRCTDPIFLIVFVVYFLIMIACSAALICTNEMKTALHRYDSCDNECERNNTITPKKEGCKAEDYTNFPILLYLWDDKQCIKQEDCKPPERELYFKKCFLANYDSPQHNKMAHQLFDNIIKSSIPITAMGTVAAGLTLVMYLCFWINTRATCVVLTFLSTIIPAVTAALSWYILLVNHVGIFIIPSILATVYLAALVIILIFISDEYSLIIRLYIEATKAIFKEPIVLIQPLVTIFCVLIFDAAVLYFIVLLYFSEDINTEEIKFWHICCLVFLIYWVLFFIHDCQYMVVTAVISTHYFTRDADKPWPTLIFWKSVWILLRYHLGTVAAGSLVMPILRILKPLAHFTERRQNIVCVKLSSLCCTKVGEVAEYFRQKAFIVTALHGRGINPSGKRAGRLLWLFFFDLIVVDGLAYLAVYAVGVLIVLCSMIVGVGFFVPLHLGFEKICLFLGLFVSGTVVYFYVIVMNTVIKTLIICFCEDRILNDGSRFRPYFMSPDLYKLLIEALELVYKEREAGSDDVSELYTL